jgi:isoleucyl-tRNA synthetase
LLAIIFNDIFYFILKLIELQVSFNYNKKIMFKPVYSKVDFPQIERELLEKWVEKGIVERYLHRNDKSAKRFSFFDGPITANNPMGVHHGWGRTYKDLWRRFFNMRGYAQRFQNGFDCQGLWVEVEVEKELGIRNKRDIENLVMGKRKESIAKFVSLCKERVLKFSDIQTEQSKRLGFFMDWDNSYFTMSDENNYMIWYFLKTCHEKGWIYKGIDNVTWCPRCETAISQHEMLTEDYKEVQHETVFVKLPVISQGWENTFLLVWTTTPWTIPANVAVGVNTKFTYGVWSDHDTGEKFIFLYTGDEGKPATRVDKKGRELSLEAYIMDNTNRTFDPPQKFYKGNELIGLRYRAPFDDLPIVQSAQEEHPKTFHKVVDASEIVVATEGTGLLHVATGAGKEDFDLGKKQHLSVISPIDDTATYVQGMGEFSGKNAKKHPEIIIDYLRDLGGGEFLFKTMHYTHRYPACWRCKTELVWKIADEWYIAMDKPEKGPPSYGKGRTTARRGKTLRMQMVEVAKKIDWHPGFGLERELDWLKNMHDWMISKKNRYWGLALPIYECQKCGSFEVIGSREELRDRAVSGWKEFSGHSPHKPYIDEVKIGCNECGEMVSRLDDVGNVWLDAGIVPFSTLVDPVTGKLSYTTDRKYFKKWFPGDFITESFPGQFKNWFYSLIAMSTVLEKTNPIRAVLGYASVIAEDGRPMHKSWGNAIEFNEGAEKMGVDVMRWMYVTADTEQNLLFGYKKADEVRRRFHLMLWNIYNFFVTYANVDGWEPNMAKFSSRSSENPLDIWIISRMHGTIRVVTESLEKYDAQKASLRIESFVHDLSLWYIRRSRDRVGPSAVEGQDKKNFYETAYAVLTTLSKLLAPFMPFISDEMYTNLTGQDSVHLANWPEFREQLIDEDLEKEMARARELASVVLMKRKTAGVKVRMPLMKISYKGLEKLSEEVIRIVQEEVNVDELVYEGRSDVYEVVSGTEEFTAISNQDVEGGVAREIVRQIQEERKKLETRLDERVDVMLPEWPGRFEDYIKRNALVESLGKGEFRVRKLDD